MNYVKTHDFESIVNTAVNNVLKKRPADPLSDMAMMLLQASGTSFPTFDKFQARRVYLQESPTLQTFQIQVYMGYQGRVGLRYKHTFSYDQEELGTMLFDNEGEKTGLSKTCELINVNLNIFLAEKTSCLALDRKNLKEIDEQLVEFF